MDNRAHQSINQSRDSGSSRAWPKVPARYRTPPGNLPARCRIPGNLLRWMAPPHPFPPPPPPPRAPSDSLLCALPAVRRGVTGRFFRWRLAGISRGTSPALVVRDRTGTTAGRPPERGDDKPEDDLGPKGEGHSGGPDHLGKIPATT